MALPSATLGRKPRPVTLFGQELVAWRGAGGRPVIMRRHCPHMGASLARGRLVDGLLECPFHGWRFDTSGSCAAIPGSERIPAAASSPPYPVVERYGYVWVWYGGPEPIFDLPDMPSMAPHTDRYRHFRLADTTNATVRRIMENTYDPDHLIELHGLEVAGHPSLRMVDDPGVFRDHGAPMSPDVWVGAELTWPRYAGRLGNITRLLGTNAGSFVLRVDGWAAGQRISYLADGAEQYQLLLAATPIAANRTVQHITVAVEKSGRRARDLFNLLVNRLEITFTSNQDLPIFNTIREGDEHGIYLDSDHGVRRFRKHYQSWVDRADARV
ncbi:hypothetical protein Axi01nite_72850 [Actinoplanes xinjiangensis]|nr:hypothetical protein Axi01nite_72850 [Actinoplanes xinjiangensis]